MNGSLLGRAHAQAVSLADIATEAVCNMRTLQPAATPITLLLLKKEVRSIRTRNAVKVDATAQHLLHIYAGKQDIRKSAQILYDSAILSHRFRPALSIRIVRSGNHDALKILPQQAHWQAP